MLFPDESFFEGALFQCLGREINVQKITVLSGGDINEAYKLTAGDSAYFIKINTPEVGDLFEKEARGMKVLKQANALTIPSVIGEGVYNATPFILLEFIEQGAPKGTFWEEFGQSLAALHQNHANQFGLDHDNYIGRLPQKNSWRDTWIDFFIENRLEVQLGLAIYNGHVDHQFADRFRLMYPKLPGLLPEEKASLLHGDLWSGNFMCDAASKPCIFDPAIYYGSREMELAFTQLFGGFDQQFYQSYNDAYPLEPGFGERTDIYNLYPLLVHVNLFGPSYLSGINSTLNRHL